MKIKNFLKHCRRIIVGLICVAIGLFGMLKGSSLVNYANFISNNGIILLLWFAVFALCLVIATFGLVLILKPKLSKWLNKEFPRQ